MPTPLPRFAPLALAASLVAPGCTSGTLNLDDDDSEGDDDVAGTLAVSFASPDEGARVNGLAQVDAVVTGASGAITVSFEVDGAAMGSDSDEPYHFDWDTTGAAFGEHVLTVRATAGDESASAQRTVTVDQLPVVTITSPGEGATVGGEVALAAEVLDDDGVASVEAQFDGVAFALDDAAPFEGIVDTCGAPSGTHTLTAVATDSGGQTGSASISVTLSQPDGDGDGADACEDCDDGDDSVYPGADEVCGDDIDQDCDGDLGDCPTDPSLVDGRTYVINLGTGSVTVPKGIGAYIDDYLSLVLGSALIQVTGVDEDAASLQGLLAPAVGEGASATQDLCQPTAELDSGDGGFPNPAFELVGDSLYLSAFGYGLPLEESVYAGDFSSDGTSMADVALITQLDTRYVDEFIGDPGTACSYVGYVGAECVSCASDGEPYCLDLVLSALEGEQVGELELEPRTEGDIAGDPDCE